MWNAGNSKTNQEARKAGGKAAGAATGSVIGLTGKSTAGRLSAANASSNPRRDSRESLAINPERVQGLQVSICCWTWCTIATAAITTMAAMTWCG
jgi:hypothetical protein